MAAGHTSRTHECILWPLCMRTHWNLIAGKFCFVLGGGHSMGYSLFTTCVYFRFFFLFGGGQHGLFTGWTLVTAVPVFTTCVYFRFFVSFWGEGQHGLFTGWTLLTAVPVFTSAMGGIFVGQVCMKHCFY